MIRFTTTLTLLLALTPACAAEARIIVQQSPLAGFQYYDGKVLWDNMRVGDTLTLVREPQNPHDTNAVRVVWNGQSLGYVPRRGAPVQARIINLKDARNPWQRVEFEIFVELAVTRP